MDFKKLIKSRHPYYNEDTLNNLWHAYWGDAAYAADNITSHRLENDDDLLRRKRDAVPKTITRDIIETRVDYLFGPAWAVKSTSPVITALVNSCNKSGEGLWKFARLVTQWAQLYGYAIVGIDAPALPEGVQVRSKRDELAYGVQPYLYYLDPRDVLDWRADDDGMLTEFLVREKNIVGSIGQFESSDDAWQTTYRYWTPEACTVIDGEGNPIEEYANHTGMVPFVSVQCSAFGDPVFSFGVGESAEKFQRRVMNLESQLDEILARQTFSQLVAQGVAEDYGEAGDIKKLGTSSIMIYPEGANPPEYISPDAGQAELLRREREYAEFDAYIVAGLKPPNMKAVQEIPSGIALRMEFIKTNQMLSNVANAIAPALRRALWIAARMGNKSDTQPESSIVIDVPNDFAIVSVDSEIARLDALRTAQASTVIVDAQERNIVAAGWPKDKKLAKDLETEQSTPDPEPPQTTAFDAFGMDATEKDQGFLPRDGE